MVSSVKRSKKLSHSALMRYARILGFGNIHHRIDSETGLDAIIAIHNINRGPAIGGCRFYTYDSYNQALLDVLRLASGMTLKNAACGLAHGGGKAVIIKPKQDFDRETLFQAFGDFVNDLNGDYITAMDIGTSTQDMDCIARRTPHVIGSVRANIVQEDPSPYTARGVLRGIEAAVKFKLKRNNLEGITVAIQGTGKVGYSLAKILHGKGAKLIVADINPVITEKLADECNAQVVPTDKIIHTSCDVFAPCATGNSITSKSVKHLKAKIVAGSANNQLSHTSIANMLMRADILYAPDFVVNAGGVIQAASVHDYHDIEIANTKIDELYDRLYLIFERAQKQEITTAEIAYEIARENLVNIN